MSLESVLKNAWNATLENVREKRYLRPSNYVSDIAAGNISRTPAYMVVDNILLGVPDENVLASAGNSLMTCVFGWSLVYTLGNSVLATGLGETYQEHKKKIDATYSAVLTFGFGMTMNLWAGYDLKQATTASVLRAAIGIPLGPVTRYYTDSFRQSRGEVVTAADTHFKDKDWRYSMSQIVAMIALPIAIAGAAILATPEGYRGIHSVIESVLP
ncbi:hypothetical protein HYV86_06090 [Candidatus Woesearchaeota archaeon]|nr:hypothetical protein [Candidatus Woesearchaeota archaeon]